MTRWRRWAQEIAGRLWVRAALYGLLGVATAIISAFAEPFLPWRFSTKLDADAVSSVLNVIASSMLAVTTFSLSVMTSAYGSAASGATPRATKLLMNDRVTHGALSTFIGSFLFSIVGIVMLKTGAYGDRGRVVLFAATILVIALVVLALLRWIDHLLKLGRLGETTERVEAAARAALEARLKAPYLGGERLKEEDRTPPAGSWEIRAGEVGYLRHVDMEELARIAAGTDRGIRLSVLPGAFVFPDTPLLWLEPPEETGERAEEIRSGLRAAFSFGLERDYEQDPRFGLSVMSEIATRALPPTANDPGTAIGMIGRLAAMLSLWGRGIAAAPAPEEAPAHPRVHVPPLRTADLFDDAFMLIGRDGAGLIEVQLRLRKALLGLSRMGDAEFQEAARVQAAMALERAEAALTLEEDRRRLSAVTSEPDLPSRASLR
ncbi:DUF2254 domain-containing protein [Neomegalonema perideroedes]|uniref:DUF2254 domain-containing protein n=1 Tax=Neomegalonema perideroedes TaxID=217219 RepID=UPI00036A175B|nr:DUF2254 domain-containing protein [Neomegalonema perideroedes]